MTSDEEECFERELGKLETKADAGLQAIKDGTFVTNEHYRALIKSKGITAPELLNKPLLKAEWERVKYFQDWERKEIWDDYVDQRELEDVLENLGFQKMNIDKVENFLDSKLSSVSNEHHRVDMEEVIAAMEPELV